MRITGRPGTGSRGKRPPRSSAADRNTPIGEWDEFRLIDRLVRALGPCAPPPPAGPGDDAAVLAKGSATLVTTDTLEEDVHFRRARSLPEEVGEKALESNLSDIAAMGGRPTAAVLSLVLPAALPLGALDALCTGIARSARRAGVRVVGGNVARAASDRVAIHVTAFGTPEGRRPVLRSGGSPGDLLVVTGIPGLAGLGRRLIERAAPGESLWTGEPRLPEWRRALTRRAPDGAAGRRASPAVARAALERFLTPRARLDAGSWAARHGARAMIDLSDGLGGDLGHLARASGAGARILAERLPAPEGFRRLAAEVGVAPLDLALSGGEDYELLFAIPASRWNRLHPPAGLRFTVIGELLPEGSGLRLVRDGAESPLPESGFRHFG